jgi:hypothetical protein
MSVSVVQAEGDRLYGQARLVTARVSPVIRASMTNDEGLEGAHAAKSLGALKLRPPLGDLFIEVAALKFAVVCLGK